ncbi:MAG: putative hydroxymethylpyrimidine transporter CytX [Campylobacterales bacterium]|nr:putative hydroxymethylpyrimidine transporter CytX [Campylobacterales bacterium]
MQPKRETFGNFTLLVLWFGASVSIAEIMTGGLLAPMGFSPAVVGIVVGHVIGAALLYFGGTIGAQSGLPSMVSTRMSFGLAGSQLFAVLNILQLIGWTAIMIIAGANAANEIGVLLMGVSAPLAWSLALGAAIMVWIWLGAQGFTKLNVMAVVLLFGLTLVLAYVVFGKEVHTIEVAQTTPFSMGLALELSIIMPLSWLPLIGDYTRFAKDKTKGVWSATTGYFLGSTLMYIIGLGAALYSGSADPSAMMLAANLGLFALGIVVLSTVTTTFLDAYSAGVSATAIFPQVNERYAALGMAFVGLCLALWVPMHQYEHFLYAIGSVFGPLFAIILCDYFFFQTRTIRPTLLLHVNALVVWMVGVGAYYGFKGMDLGIGAVLPTMLFTALVFTLVKKSVKAWNLEG